MSQTHRAELRHSRQEYHDQLRDLKSPETDKLLINLNPSLPKKDLYLDSQSYNLKTSQDKRVNCPESSLPSLPKARGEEWTSSEEELLVDLHNSKGNRWVEIAQQLHRDDNAVKNHYHSRLRKTLRKINKCLSDNHISTRPLKNSVISKIVQTAEEIYAGGHLEPSSSPKRAFSTDLKNRILGLSSLNQEQISQSEVQEVRTLFAQIEAFVKGLKSAKKDRCQKKQANNKYKGKQIRSLLTENQRNKSQNPPPTNSRRPLSFISQEEEVERDENEEENKGNCSLGTSSAPGSPNNFQNCFSFNIPLYPYPPVFYPYCHPSSFLFSGRNSSFTSYHPEPQSDFNRGWSSMRTLGDSEQSFENRPKQSLL